LGALSDELLELDRPLLFFGEQSWLGTVNDVFSDRPDVADAFDVGDNGILTEPLGRRSARWLIPSSAFGKRPPLTPTWDGDVW
jgi:hypothetical protein